MSIYERFSPEELAILKARAERAARASQDEQADDSRPALVAMVREELYAMPLGAITAVYAGITVVPVPCTPPFVAGVANVRGHIIPVVDLATLLGVPGESTSDATVLIVVTNDEMSAAFCVEAIGEVMPLSKDNLNPIPATLAVAQTAYLEGVLSDGTVLLDVEAILNDPALIVDEMNG